jgi:uncharacterized protein (TIGR02145 family)
MKKLLAILISPLLLSSLLAQSPEKMSYQTVIRNSNDQLVRNSYIGIQISILQGSEAGEALYVEKDFPHSNDNGLVSIEIGGGAVVNGTFSSINWANGPFYIKTEIDLNGGANYTITQTSQILSVPYSLYAKTAGDAFSGAYADLSGRPDFSKWDKDSTDNVTISGSQVIEGKKTFNDTIIAVNGLDLNNKSVFNLPDPVNNQDIATKAYVDALANELYSQDTLKLKDADGNLYKVVIIGSQVWMAENLRTSRYNDGTVIPLDTDNAVWGHQIAGAYCWYNNNEVTYKNTYGAMYNWYAVSSGKLCPTGWHVPTEVEWSALSGYLGDSIAGGKLKETGTIHWTNPNTGATNETGFTALPGGLRPGGSPFILLNERGYCWSMGEQDASRVWYLYFSYDSSLLLLYRDDDFKEFGMSVRCLKN